MNQRPKPTTPDSEQNSPLNPNRPPEPYQEAEKVELAGDGWDSPSNDPIKDCIRGAMSMGYSEREAEIFIECLMGKRKFTTDLHIDFLSGRLRRSLEKP